MEIIIKYALRLEVYIYRNYKQNPHAPKLQQNLHGVKKLQTVAKLESNMTILRILSKVPPTPFWEMYTIHIPFI